MYIKGIQNTIVYVISWLDYGPIKDDRNKWMTFTLCCCYITKEDGTSMTNNKEAINFVFVNHNEENTIFPLTTKEIVESQNKDIEVQALPLG